MLLIKLSLEVNVVLASRNEVFASRNELLRGSRVEEPGVNEYPR